MVLANTFFNGPKNLSKSSLQKMWTHVSVLSSKNMSSKMMSSTKPLTVMPLTKKPAMLTSTMLSWTTSTRVPTTSMSWAVMSLKSFHTSSYLNQRERDEECVLCKMEKMHADLMKDERSWAVVADTNGNAFNLVIDPSTNIQAKLKSLSMIKRMKTRPAAVGYAETEMEARPEAAGDAETEKEARSAASSDAEASSYATPTIEEMNAEADGFFKYIFNDYGNGVAKNWDCWAFDTVEELAKSPQIRNGRSEKRMSHEKKQVERRDAHFASAVFKEYREVDEQKNVSANKFCDNDSGNDNNHNKLGDRKNHNDNNNMNMDDNNNSHEKMGPGLWDGKFYPNQRGSKEGPSAASSFNTLSSSPSSAPPSSPPPRPPPSTPLPSPPSRAFNSGSVNNKENVVVVDKSRSLDWSLYLMFCGLACGGAAAGYQLYLQSKETKKPRGTRGTSGSGKKRAK